MQLALLLSRLLLSAVFLLAGVAKIGDAKGAIQALKDFGIPARLAPPLSLLLLAGEILVGVALIPLAFAWYGACGALALFCIFLLAIGIAMARGRNPDCHCFGKLHSSPIGWQTLVRNGILGALAGWLISRGPLQVGPSLWAHFASAGENERKLFICAGCVMCFLFFRAVRGKAAPQPESSVSESTAFEGLFNWMEDAPEVEPAAAAAPASPAAQGPAPTPASVNPMPPKAAPAPGKAPAPAPVRKVQPPDPALREVLQAGTGLPVGTPAPEFTMPNLIGQSRSLRSIRQEGKTVCLVFASPYCDPCKALLPYLGRWIHEHERWLNIVMISRGAATQNLAKLNGFDASRVLLQHEFELSNAYGVRSTPAAVLISPDGRIQSEPAVGKEDIQRLIASMNKPSSLEAQSEQPS